jgi:copper chaperone NosL
MKDKYSRLSARTLLTALFAALLLLAACGETKAPVQPLEISKNTVCALDDMVLQDFPGPKAQIHYEQSAPEFYCDTREMFSIVLRPEQKKHIVGVFTQDMGKADWTHPQGHWIDARTAFYVVGSRRTGSMGPTMASFGAEADAKNFSAKYGGKVLRFDQVTLDMVDLTGGIVHDEKM